ncbi:MAG: winged helix-turn-helix transcriptional regulator [Dehalococcoidia bacterium]|nr:winged helix-turn-helix transcriptional regulator [Dehalococcoidia bacterium]
MPNPADLNEDEKTWETVFRTAAALERTRQLELSRVGIRLPQAAILHFLGTSREPLTPVKLSRLIHKKRHTITALVHRMEAQGLVSTEKDMARKNWLRVSLTKKGKAAFRRQLSERTAMNITACLSRQEVATLNRIMRKLYLATDEMRREMEPSPYDHLLRL